MQLYNFAPPAPIRHDVSDEDMMVAEARLRRALQLNRNQSRPRHGISRDDANNLLKWIIENDRLAYHPDYPEKGLTNLNIDSVCGRSAALCYWPLSHIVPKDRLNVFNVGGLFGQKAGVHEAVAVKLPIAEDGKVADTVFLLDNSYGQFFKPEFNTPPRERLCEGYFTTRTQEGRDFANQLLQDGFIELNKPNASIYLHGFIASRKQSSPDFVTPDYVREDPVNAFMSPNLSTKTLRPEKPIDYLLEEIHRTEYLQDVAVKTPLTAHLELHGGTLPSAIYTKAFSQPPILDGLKS